MVIGFGLRDSSGVVPDGKTAALLQLGNSAVTQPAAGHEYSRTRRWVGEKLSRVPVAQVKEMAARGE